MIGGRIEEEPGRLVFTRASAELIIPSNPLDRRFLLVNGIKFHPGQVGFGSRRPPIRVWVFSADIQQHNLEVGWLSGVIRPHITSEQQSQRLDLLHFRLRALSLYFEGRSLSLPQQGILQCIAQQVVDRKLPQTIGPQFRVDINKDSPGVTKIQFKARS